MQLLTLNLGLVGIDVGPLRLPLAPHERARAAAASALAGAGADVLFLQEVFGRRRRARLAAALAQAYPYKAADAGGALFDSGLMILSRRPLSEAEFAPLEPRGWAHPLRRRGVLAATADLPGLGRVTLVDAHLTADPPNAAGGPSAGRLAETERLLDFVAARRGATILAGDFNCSPVVAPALYRRIVDAGFVDAFAAACDDPERHPTWDPRNPLSAGGPWRDAPAQRIDHVFLSRDLAARVRVGDVRLALERPCVATGAGLMPLSDHAAVVAGLAPLVDEARRAAAMDALPA